VVVGQVTNHALRAMAVTGQATLQGALQELAGRVRPLMN
jgi:hypothetical protein